MVKRVRVLGVLITVVQLCMALTLVVLEILSGYSAGVMHHLYFKKFYYLGSLYQQSNVIFHVIGMGACGLLIAMANRGRWDSWRKRGLFRFAVACSLLVLCYTTVLLKNLNVYAYILIVLECWVLLETVRTVAR